MSDNSEPFEEENKSEMIEDEEMPTFISVSSNKDISLPYNTDGNIQLLAIDNNSGNNSLLNINSTNNEEHNPDDYEAQSRSVTTEERDQEEVNDENEDGSVYVLSSGDDADDPDHNDPSSRSYDEDLDDEEDDVDDEDDEDIDDMDEIEGEEEDVRVAEDGQLLGDFSEDEIEKEDVMSDDMALRPDKPATINNEKRSQSLQDLSEYKSQPKRKSFITGGGKYNRVQSKVKRYIEDLKAVNRRSAENRLKIIENNRELYNKVAEEKLEAEEYLNLKKSTKGRRSIKDYAEKALKDLEIREAEEEEEEEEEGGSQGDEENELPEEEEGEEEIANCNIKPNNNMQNKGNLKTEINQRYNTNTGFKTASEIYKARKTKNVNGENLALVDVNDGLKSVKIPKGITLNYITLNNGQIQDENILDVRSIGYDEYMRGSSNFVGEKNADKEEIGEKLNRDIQMTSKFEITNIRSESEPNNVEINDIEDNFEEEETPMELVDDDKNTEIIIEQEKEKENDDKAEMAIIQSQLNQKTTQCKEIREAYEKTLSENFQLKQELEDLKKTMAKLTAKKPAPAPPQLVTVAVQTDPPPLPPPQISNETQDIQASDNFLNPKTSTSTIGSALSSNEHWTESAGSLPMSNGSIRPLPNLTPLSNAEDSFIGVASTPTRAPKQPSHAFQTSSKIIKMLSSITSRKQKGEASSYREENSSNIFGKGCSVAPSPGISNYNYNSPINHRVSNKRKASDMPENANILQPPKIPHTISSGGGNRLNKRNNKSEFKYPGDFIKLNSQSQCSSSSVDPNLNRTLENLENSQREDEPREDDLNSGVKCFTYREDQNSRETSFLIQAEDEAKSQNTRNDGERNSIAIVRECGPYLLGNVEVRMTEINGTINIWGKEVSQEKTTVEDEPEEEEEKEVDLEDEIEREGACACWQNTPNTRLSGIGPMSCSTNKKPKIPVLRLNDSSYSKNHYNPPRGLISDNLKDRQNIRNVDNDDNSCRVCSNPSRSNNSRLLGFNNKFKRYETNFGEETAAAEEEEEEQEEDDDEINYYQCNWDNGNCDNNHSSCERHLSRHRNHNHNHSEHNCASNNYNLRGTTGTVGGSRCSRFNNLNDNNKRLLKTEEDNLNRNKSSSSRLLSNNLASPYSSCRHGLRRDSRDLDDDVFKRPSASNNRINNDGCCKNPESCSRSRSTSISNQSNEPLLSHNPHEPPETRRRRSSGKRVRGILMDFLRGCGDCRTTNGPDNKVSPSVIPQIQIRSDTPPPSCGSQNQQQQRASNSHGSGNKKCVHVECCATCSKRIEMAAEIETQLEIFGAEMERLRSRSQAVLGMLNTLHSADNTNRITE